jgi:uncharacterized membrane protein YkvA (DUF1232 family)
MKWIEELKEISKKLKKEVYALSLAYKDNRVKFPARVIIIIVIAYALSPVDLIPDFIPVLGCLDDLVLIPLGIAIAIKLIPKEVMSECRDKAEKHFVQMKKNRIAGFVIILLWLSIVFILGRSVYGIVSGK